MYKIGITGSIGTGKTTIAKMFHLFNIPVFDADQEIKKILNYKIIKQELESIWPSIIKNNKINKLKLRSIIFSSKEDKRKLEQLLYPYLKVEKKKFEKSNHFKNILVYDVPLIYETKSQNKYDLILLANCNEILQKERVLNRDKISSELFKKIVASQLSFKKKLEFKPKIINTNRSKIFIFLEVVLLIINIVLKEKLKTQNGNR